MLPERLAALAVERQARRIHEDGREIGEQVTPAIEQLLLDDVLDAARRQSPFRLLFHLFTEPSHRPIEMVEVETIDAENVVVLHPGRASRSDPETKSRCKVPTKTARSTANSNARCFSSSPNTSAMPSRSQIRPNSNGPPIRLAAMDNDLTKFAQAHLDGIAADL